ncbi:MAG TPA: DUF5615 family PIN-like protein [Pirellulales bacterium]|nr:DUF5615 family PIN-like protein [Pirellulales bacterium]
MSGAFKLDENLPKEAIDLLCAAGHDAIGALGQGLGGRADGDLISVCHRERRAIITLDLDFADIRAYPPTDHHGLVVLRLQRHSKDRILDVIRRVVTLLESELVSQRLWIVDEANVRIRS